MRIISEARMEPSGPAFDRHRPIRGRHSGIFMRPTGSYLKYRKSGGRWPAPAVVADNAAASAATPIKLREGISILLG
jgi:hypothetical protein